MIPNEDAVLRVAQIVNESVAMNEAALAGDFDEARFRAQLIVSKAGGAGLGHVVLAAARVVDQLGPMGAVPKPGYGEVMLAVAHALDDVGVEPI
jgi:hypothetical protein